MLYRQLFIVLCLFLGRFANAQLDSILSLPGKEAQQRGFIDWAYLNIYLDGKHINWEKEKVMLSDAYKRFSKAGDQKLIREAWFNIELSRIGGAVVPFDPGKAADHMLKAAENANKKGWAYTEAQCRMAASTIYFYRSSRSGTSEYGEAFEQSDKAYEIFKKEGLEKYPEANRYIAEIADRYYSFEEYENAIHYFKEALRVPMSWATVPNSYSMYNTVAMCYEWLEKYDSAIYFFQKANDEAIRQNNEFWTGLTSGNLGEVHFFLKQEDKALPLLLKDFKISNSASQFRSAANVAITLATIYTHQENAAEAEKYITYAQDHYDPGSMEDKIKVFQRLGQLNALKGDYRNAHTYLDSFVYLGEKLSNEQGEQLMTHSKQMLQIEKYAAKIKLLESNRRVQALIRNGIIGMIILSCLIAAIAVSRVRSKKNSAIKMADLEKRIVAKELNKAKTELAVFTRILTEKNEMIETFKSSIERMQVNAIDDRDTILSQLTSSIILTEHDWAQFRQLFNKAYPGFFMRIEEKIQDVTPSDMRLIALTKLGLSQKEMAAMLGIGYDAIRKARQRLRSKIDTGKDDSIEELVGKY